MDKLLGDLSAADAKAIEFTFADAHRRGTVPPDAVQRESYSRCRRFLDRLVTYLEEKEQKA
jgi:hypothetical protein